MESPQEPWPAMKAWHAKRALSLMLAWMVTVVLLVACIDRGIVSDGLLLAVLAVVFVGGVVAIFKALRVDEIAYANHVRRKRAVREAEEHSAAPVADSNGSGDASPYWATGSYDPERYGRFVRTTPPEQREYIRDAYGDLDMYESNAPD